MIPARILYLCCEVIAAFTFEATSCMKLHPVLLFDGLGGTRSKNKFLMPVSHHVLTVDQSHTQQRWVLIWHVQIDQKSTHVIRTSPSDGLSDCGEGSCHIIFKTYGELYIRLDSSLFIKHLWGIKMILLLYRNPGPAMAKKNSPLTGRNLEQTRLIWGGGAPADGQLGKEGEWGKDREKTHRSYLQLHVSNMPKNASGVWKVKNPS